jgi:ATP-dependent DNA ligase
MIMSLPLKTPYPPMEALLVSAIPVGKNWQYEPKWDGLLHHVGFTSSFNEAERKELTKRLKPLVKPPGFTGNRPGGPSRWSTKRTSEWEPLETKLVAEVRYDHFTGGRFRHGAKFLRWRPEKKPTQCGFDQLERGSVAGPCSRGSG